MAGCRSESLLLFRPPSFLETTVQFLSQLETVQESSLGVELKCWRVPPHLQDQHWQDVLDERSSELDVHLVLPVDSHVKKVLGKFELDQDCIHCFRRASPPSSRKRKRISDTCAPNDPAPRFLWELPRFNMEFELHSDGKIESRDYAGYQLGQAQQLVGTLPELADGSVAGSQNWYSLPEFKQYLVLVRQPSLSAHTTSAARRPDVLVIVPEGKVVMSSSSVDASVVVQVSDNCSESLKVSEPARSCRLPHQIESHPLSPIHRSTATSSTLVSWTSEPPRRCHVCSSPRFTQPPAHCCPSL